MPGYLYIATNPLMPGLTKIGFTEKAISQRFSELQSTGVPVPFELFAAIYVEDPQSCEKGVHSALVEVRVSDNREFFKIAAKDALSRVWPLVLSHAHTSSAEKTSTPTPFGDLDSTEREILSSFTQAPSPQRPNDWEWLKHFYGMDELDGRHYLHSLKTKGYLREVRGRAGAILYDLTPRGVLFGRSIRNE